MSDILILETADGQSLVLSGEVFNYEVFPGNFGAPPINYIQRQGYKQHGTTEIDYILSPRQFDLAFWRAPACDRETYWQNRAELVDIFRPNRGGQITFTLYRANGTKRALKVRPDPGLVFPATPSNNNWNIQESLSLIAFDPIWFDPTVNSLTVSASISSDLVFPITFPIQFGASGLLFTQAITYLGNWPSFPTLTLTGPYTSAIVTNLTTGVSIFFSVPISTGEQRILDLTPGNQSLVDQDGDSAVGDLGPLSNLVNFNLRPDPETAGGAQTIQAILYGGSNGVSGFALSYYDKYLGI